MFFEGHIETIPNVGLDTCTCAASAGVRRESTAYSTNEG